ncbi:MAG: hypothetical protein KF911_02190 [Pseudomonadales bacterium]|nr:hypothetical protein [Pseudomonadales bacterium]
MNLEALGNLGEFVGGLVVVVSLVYLARQIRQNTRAQRMQAYAVALGRISEFQSSMSHDPAFSEILLEGVLHPDRMSQAQRVQFTWVFYEMFGAFEFIYLQSESGDMPDEVWARWSSTLRWWISFPGVRAWWDARPAPFTDAFSRQVEMLRDSGPADAAAQARWAAWLQGTVPGASRT